jgi:hypothetical protein
MIKQQQGDCIIKQINELPQSLTPIAVHPRGGYVLAHGEATGHMHLLAADGVTVYEDAHGVLWIQASKAAVLTHEEHRAQIIAPGVYRVDRVREYDAFAEEAKQVTD